MTEPAPRPHGDEERASLRALDERFRASLIRYFSRRITDKSEIEDLVQEVFLRLIRRGGVSNLDHLSGYVFEAAKSALLDRLRRRRTHHLDEHDEFDGSRHGGVDFSPEHVLLERERLARATAILHELPERTRVVFILRRLEGMRYLDIAARLGISVSAVEKHVGRAVAYLLSRSEDL